MPIWGPHEASGRRRGFVVATVGLASQGTGEHFKAGQGAPDLGVDPRTRKLSRSLYVSIIAMTAGGFSSFIQTKILNLKILLLLISYRGSGSFSGSVARTATVIMRLNE